MTKRTIDDAFQVLDQIEWQLEGQAVAQRYDAAYATSCNTVGERVDGVLHSHIRLAMEITASLE